MKKLLMVLGAAFALVIWLAIPGTAFAQGAECNGGLCGTPDQSGGGCGCGCGSVLVAMTDSGDTYQFADDFDGDGIEDEFDTCPFVSNFDQADADGDLVGDACDNCPAAYNPDQADLDGNHVGNVCDPDKDGDGKLNGEDNCPDVPNANQAATLTAGIGDACNPNNPCRVDPVSRRMVDPANCTSAGDSDGDGVTDNLDNCPFIYNPIVGTSQPDMDSDGVGDACSPDIDGDSIPNEIDNCPAVFNPSQLDLDYDGLGDAGNWSSGAESCDSQECYVIGGDRANCLDPNATFTIYLTLVGERLPNGKFNVDSDITVALFSNRLGMLHNWTASFTQLPDGSDTSIYNAEGSGATLDQSPQVANCLASDSDGNCTKLNNIRFAPDVAGEYVIKVNATLPGSSVESAATFSIMAEVEGTPKGGCAAAGSSAGLVALALGLFIALRRRH